MQITRLKIYSNPFAKGFRDSIRFLGDTERFVSISIFFSAHGRNSTNPAIWLVPGAGGIFSSGPGICFSWISKLRKLECARTGNRETRIFWLRFLILPKAWSVRSHLLTKNATENTQECCFIIFLYRESYLMSNGIQAYENGDGTCFLSSGALTHGSRDLFSEGRYSFIGESAQFSCLRGYFISSRVQYAEDNCFMHP